MKLKNMLAGLIFLSTFIGSAVFGSTALGSTVLGSTVSKSYQVQSVHRGYLAQKKPSESKAKKILKALERKNPKSHFYSRHGASTTLNQQKRRAQFGITPDGQLQPPVSGARWLNHRDQLFYYNKAKKIHLRTGQRVVDLWAPYYIGEGYLKGGKKYTKTKRARFVFHQGQIVTAFPVLG